MLSSDIINDFKLFDWKKVLEKDLDDLNDAQWRFLKGLIVELTLEKYSGENGLVYVGDIHKDFDWPKHNLTVELKSQMSSNMYCKSGQLAKNYTIKLNNSNGTNNKTVLGPNDVADILIVVKNDGAFILDKDTVLKNARKGGDGFDVKVHNSEIIEITDKIIIDNKVRHNFKDMIINAIRPKL